MDRRTFGKAIFAAAGLAATARLIGKSDAPVAQEVPPELAEIHPSVQGQPVTVHYASFTDTSDKAYLSRLQLADHDHSSLLYQESHFVTKDGGQSWTLAQAPPAAATSHTHTIRLG